MEYDNIIKESKEMEGFKIKILQEVARQEIDKFTDEDMELVFKQVTSSIINKYESKYNQSTLIQSTEQKTT